MSSVIRTRSLTKRFGSKVALDGVSIDVPRGGVHAVVGGNGAGKSTLFRILLGFEQATSGWCEVLGEPSVALSPQARGRIAWIQEDHALPSWMRIGDAIRFHSTRGGEFDLVTFSYLADHFSLPRTQRIGKLSRGERAGLCLSLALAQRPELVIFDEPTLGLDVVAKQAFIEALVGAMAEASMTALYCSHEMSEIEQLGERVLVLDRGRVRAFEEIDAFSDRITHWAVDFPNSVDASRLPNVVGARMIEGVHHVYSLDASPSFPESIEALGGKWTCTDRVPFSEAIGAILIGSRRKDGGGR